MIKRFFHYFINTSNIIRFREYFLLVKILFPIEDISSNYCHFLPLFVHYLHSPTDYLNCWCPFEIFWLLIVTGTIVLILLIVVVWNEFLVKLIIIDMVVCPFFLHNWKMRRGSALFLYLEFYSDFGHLNATSKSTTYSPKLWFEVWFR